MSWPFDCGWLFLCFRNSLPKLPILPNLAKKILLFTPNTSDCTQIVLNLKFKYSKMKSMNLAQLEFRKPQLSVPSNANSKAWMPGWTIYVDLAIYLAWPFIFASNRFVAAILIPTVGKNSFG